MDKVLLDRSFWIFGEKFTMPHLGTLEIFERKRDRKTGEIPECPFLVYLWLNKDIAVLIEYAVCETLLEAVLEGQDLIQKRISPRRISREERDERWQRMYRTKHAR